MKFPTPERMLLPAIFAVGIAVGVLAVWGAMRYTAVPLPAPTPSVQVPTPPTQEPVADGQEDTTATTTIEVAWASKATALTMANAKEIFAEVTTDTMMFDVANRKTEQPNWSPSEEQEWFIKLWLLGSVSSGGYINGKVYLLDTAINAPGGESFDMIIIHDKKMYFLPTYSYGGASAFINLHAQQLLNTRISSLDTSSSLTLANGKSVHRVGDGFPVSFFFGEVPYLLPQDFSDLKLVTTSQDGRQLYAFNGMDGCLYLVLPDGQLVKYESRIPTAEPQKTDNGGVHPDVVWNPSFENTAVTGYLDKAQGGCGGMGCTNIISDSSVGPLSDLVEAGKTRDGDSIYTPKDPMNDPAVKSLYDSWYIFDQTPKPSFATFVKSHPTPVFIWKDAVGRWVLHTTADATTAAECGKPVIYLYPEKTTRVSVKLPSFIDVTKSEPTYPSTGWVVTAHPDGTLEYADGKTYGSLFWEGTGVGYQAPTEGFILKEGTVDQRLTQLLALYGLNQKESQEFRDFWVPKMTGAPYYRVSFLTSAWSKAAPLSVSPRPMTEIRIFMDWQKLDAPMSIIQPKIITPVRNGFTLVEWGGLLR